MTAPLLRLSLAGCLGLGVVAVCSGSPGAVADELAPRWSGTYLSISRACGDDELVLTAPTVTYGECRRQRVELLSEDTSGVTFLFPASDDCSWANWVLRLQKAGDSVPNDVVVTGFDYAAACREDLPTFICTFERQ